MHAELSQLSSSSSGEPCSTCLKYAILASFDTQLGRQLTYPRFMTQACSVLLRRSAAWRVCIGTQTPSRHTRTLTEFSRGPEPAGIWGCQIPRQTGAGPCSPGPWEEKEIRRGQCRSGRLVMRSSLIYLLKTLGPFSGFNQKVHDLLWEIHRLGPCSTNIILKTDALFPATHHLSRTCSAVQKMSESHISCNLPAASLSTHA
jgi:hypothetical protein